MISKGALICRRLLDFLQHWKSSLVHLVLLDHLTNDCPTTHSDGDVQSPVVAQLRSCMHWHIQHLIHYHMDFVLEWQDSLFPMCHFTERGGIQWSSQCQQAVEPWTEARELPIFQYIELYLRFELISIVLYSAEINIEVACLSRSNLSLFNCCYYCFNEFQIFFPWFLLFIVLVLTKISNNV